MSASSPNSILGHIIPLARLLGTSRSPARSLPRAQKANHLSQIEGGDKKERKAVMTTAAAALRLLPPELKSGCFSSLPFPKQPRSDIKWCGFCGPAAI